MMGLISALSIFFFAPIAGYMADRFHKRTILVSSDAVAIAAVSALALVSYLQVLSIPVISVGVLLLSVAAEFRYTVTGALLYSIATQDQLPRALSIQQVSRGLTIVGAPLLGAMLFEVFGLGLILVIDAMTFAFSIAVVMSLKLSKIPVAKKERVGFWSEMSAGILWVFNSRVHIRLLIIFISFTTSMTLFSAGLGPYILSTGTAADLGTISAAMGVGMLTAGIILASHSFGDKLWTLLYYAGFVFALCFVMWGIVDSRLAHCTLATIVGASLSIISTTSLSLWQANTPQELQGKVIAVRSSVMYALSPLAIFFSVPVVTSLLIPFLSKSQILQSVWGSTSQRSAIGLFISIIGMTLIALILSLIAQRLAGLVRTQQSETIE